MIANDGCEGGKAKTRSGASADFTEALASRCVPLLVSVPEKESIACFNGNSRSQMVPPPHPTSSASAIS